MFWFIAGMVSLISLGAEIALVRYLLDPLISRCVRARSIPLNLHPRPAFLDRIAEEKLGNWQPLAARGRGELDHLRSFEAHACSPASRLAGLI